MTRGALASDTSTDHAASVADSRPLRARSDLAGRIVVVLAMAAIVAWGIYLRVALLTRESFWMDELWTLDAISRSFKELVGARLIVDNAPPLWTSLSWVWLRVVGTYDQGALRNLATLFSIIAIAAPLVGALRMRSLRPTLLVMAALFALSILPVQYAAEMRNYSMLMGLGSIATVIWAGLLTGALPRSGRWIFAFALSGALAGFSHYYGNLLYAGEAAMLFLVLLAKRAPRRQLLLLVEWASLSLLPVVSFFLLSHSRGHGNAVAGEPTWTELRTWTGYAFAPLSNVLANEPPGYAAGAQGYGNKILVLVVVSMLVAVVGHVVAKRFAPQRISSPTVLLGACSLVVVAAGVALAWGVSVVLPPSMSVRNLAAFLPALFLATAAACTLSSNERSRWITGSVLVGVWALAAVSYVGQYGVGALGPPWQQNAGYRGAVKVLIEASEAEPQPTLVGVKQPWDWKGDYDAAIRSATGAPPADANEPSPLPVQWLLGPQDVSTVTIEDGQLIVFGYASDPRTVEVFQWAEQTHGPCNKITYGSGGYGSVDVLRCH